MDGGKSQNTKYNDGAPILYWSDVYQSKGGGTYCWYNDDMAFKDIYGALYNFDAISSGKLAPIGWHIGDIADWGVLFDFLGRAEVGNKIQEIGTEHWINPNPDATNESGFTALPGGYHRVFDGFTYMGLGTAWWRSSWGGSGGPQVLTFYEGIFYTDLVTAFTYAYVRCLKDDTPTLTTTKITDITYTTAKTGGNNLTNGGSKIISCGVCWHTRPYPTINNSKTLYHYNLKIYPRQWYY